MATLSASVENLKIESQNCDSVGNSMCLELALEGERLCKAGDCRAGVAFLQAAIQSGTDDLRTLSAIFSQLGNAYFYLGEYVKAMQYHKHDLKLARKMDDKLGEAKASGNLGNTLKVMGKFDEATICCKRHLEIARDISDRLSEGRALYNLGNVYHAKGKHIGRVGQQDPGEFSDEVKNCLLEAVKYYEQNLELMQELNDLASQGRACGNLGNTYYLLGDFEKAIYYHKMRLSIARKFGDKAAERRANSNLGNSHIFLGEFEEAAKHYKRTLSLAQELGDRAVEAQACYSLGNTYTLLRDYEAAIDYHLRHLLIAQHLQDHVGEARAYWSLGNAHAALQNIEKALYFANKHYEISKELGDNIGESTAKMNISDLKKILGLSNDIPENENSIMLADLANKNVVFDNVPKTNEVVHRIRRNSMDQLNLIKLTPDPAEKRQQKSTEINSDAKTDDDSFFELLSNVQSNRMDDQRCALQIKTSDTNNHHVKRSDSNINVKKCDSNSINNNSTTVTTNHATKNILNNNSNHLNKNTSEVNPDTLIDMILGMQSKRMDEQRVELPSLPGLKSHDNKENDEADEFFDMLAKCQSSRLEEQRTALPGTVDLESENSHQTNSCSGATVPDEDFFSLIMKMQSTRMEDQRASVPLSKNK